MRLAGTVTSSLTRGATGYRSLHTPASQRPVWYRLAATSADADRPEKLLTVPEACAALRVSKWTLYQLIRTRQLSTIKIRARRCIPAASVQALIERLRAEGGEL